MIPFPMYRNFKSCPVMIRIQRAQSDCGIFNCGWIIVLYVLLIMQFWWNSFYLRALIQSILRQANFKGATLLGASFFDADLTGSLFHLVFLVKCCDVYLASIMLQLLDVFLIHANHLSDFILNSIGQCHLLRCSIQETHIFDCLKPLRWEI